MVSVQVSDVEDVLLSLGKVEAVGGDVDGNAVDPGDIGDDDTDVAAVHVHTDNLKKKRGDYFLNSIPVT